MLPDATVRRLRFERSLAAVAGVLLSLAVIAGLLLFFFASTASAQPLVAPAPVDAQAVTITLPSGSWLVLVMGLIGTVIVWYQRYLQQGVHAKLDALANDPTKSGVVRTAAHVAEDLEPMLVAAAGSVAHTVQTDPSADLHTEASDAANSLLASMQGSLKDEASKYFGSAGGGLVDFITNVLKAKVLSMQTAKVQAATTAGAVAAVAAAATPAAAVKAINAI